MAFHASAAYVVGALGQEIGLIRNLRDGEGFDAKSLPPGMESLLTFREECIRVDDEDRFEWGLAVVLDGLRSRLS